MCPPGHASSRDPFTGRHTGRPLRSRSKYPSTPEERAGTEPRPYRSIAVPSSGPMWASAPTKGKEGCRNHPGQRRRAERLRRGWEEGVGIVAEIIPKYPATSDNPSVALRATAPFAQGSLALRGTGERADTRVRPYVVIGIASSARRGGTEPAPYGSTGSAGLRADVPKAWPPPTKFRSEIWGVGQVVGPYGRSAEALGIRPYGCSAGGAQQRRVGRVSGISWTPPPPVRRSGCCRGSRRGP